MSIERSRFASVLAGLSQEWKDAKSLAQWDPDDGQYLFRVTGVDRGESNGNGTAYLWWRVRGYIECPDVPALHGREWGPFYFTSTWFGFLKDFLTSTVGTIPGNPLEADALLDQLTGWLLLADIKTVLNKKTGKTNKNKNVLRVLERTEPGAAAAA